MKKVSIIIPIYNTCEYLTQCFNSIEEQTFSISDIEVIIVNDGSTDNSLEIIKKFIKKHSDWILVNRENRGLSISRNDGLEIATCPYVMFLDSDDYLDRNAVKSMYAAAVKTGADIIISRLNGFDSKGFYGYYSDKYIDKYDSFSYKSNKKILKAISVCSKLYKWELVENIRFIPNVKHEDNYFTLMAYNLSNLITTIPEYYYYRRYREGEKKSITQKLSLQSFNDLMLNYEYFFDNLGFEKYAVKFSLRYFNNYIINNLSSDKKNEAKKSINHYLLNLYNKNILTKRKYFAYHIYTNIYGLLTEIFSRIRSCVKYEK